MGRGCTDANELTDESVGLIFGNAERDGDEVECGNRVVSAHKASWECSLVIR